MTSVSFKNDISQVCFLCVFVSLSADSNVLFYLSDAVTQLLDHKEEYTQFGVIRYFAE